MSNGKWTPPTSDEVIEKPAWTPPASDIEEKEVKKKAVSGNGTFALEDGVSERPPSLVSPLLQPDEEKIALRPPPAPFEYEYKGVAGAPTMGQPPISKIPPERKLQFPPVERFIADKLEQADIDNTNVVRGITPERMQEAEDIVRKKLNIPIPEDKRAEIRAPVEGVEAFQYIPIAEREKYKEEYTKKLQRAEDSPYIFGTIKAINNGTANFFTTLDNAATTISDFTGLGKSGIFGKISDTLKERVEKFPDAPNTLVGNVLTDLGHLEGLFLELAITPPIKLGFLARATGGRIVEVPKIVTQLTASGFVNAYGELTKQNPEDLNKLAEGFKAAGLGAKDGTLLVALGYTGAGAMKRVFNATKSGAAAWGAGLGVNAGGFTGLTAMEQILTTGKLDSEELRRAGALGGALFFPSLPQALFHRSFSNHLTASPAAKKFAKGIDRTPQEMREKSAELREQADKETDTEKKEGLTTTATVIDNAADIKVMDNHIAKNGQEIINAIENSPLSREQKDFFVEEVNKTVIDNDPQIQRAKPISDEIDALQATLRGITENKTLPENIKEAQTAQVNKEISEKKKELAKIFAEEVPKPEEVPPEKKPELLEQPITKTTYDFESANPENLKKFDYFTKEIEGETKYFKKEKVVEPIKIVTPQEAESQAEIISEKYNIPDKQPVIAEIIERGHTINPDGTMTLYHATTKKNADRIIVDGFMRTADKAPDTYGIYFSTSPKVSESYGDGTVIKVKVHIRDLNPDDVFPSTGRMDFQVNTKRGTYKPEEVPKDILEMAEKEGVVPTEPLEPKPAEPKPEKIEPKAEALPEAEIPEIEAKGFVSTPVETLSTMLAEFQGRKAEYSPETYDRITREAKEGTLNISAIPPIQIWKNPETNKWVILSGHSRTKAFSDLAKGEQPLHAKFKTADFKNINSQIVEAKTLEEAKRVAQESNLSAPQTLIENAKYVREKLLPKLKEEKKSWEEIRKVLKSLYGDVSNRLLAFAHLNPKGDTLKSLEYFEKTQETENTTKLRDIAKWIGEERFKHEELTDAHENEMYNFLFKKNGFDDVTHTEFMQRIGAIVDKEGFNPKEPLNIEKVRYKTGAEKQYDEEIAEIKTLIEEQREKINTIKKRFDDPNDPNYIDPNNPMVDYKEMQVKAREIENSADKEIQKLEQQKLELMQQKRMIIQKGMGQTDIFSNIAENVEQKTITNEQSKAFINRTEEIDKSEPAIEDIERKAESDKQEQRDEAIRKADELISPEEPTTLKTKGGAAKIGEFEAKREGKAEPFKLFERAIDIMKKYAPKSNIVQGYTGKAAIGLFNSRTKNLRIQGLNQINVVFHELSHALDDAHKLISDLPKTDRDKLARVYLQYYPGAKETHPASKKAIEGYAMLLQKYLESPSLIKAQYPDLVTDFIDGKYAFPDIKNFLKDANQLIADYQKLAPLEKMGARIVGRLPEIKTSAQRIALKTQTEIFDHLQALENIDKETNTLFTENDVTSQIRAYDYSHNVIQNNLTGKKYLALNDKGEYEFRHNFTFETISKNLVKKHGEEGLNEFGWWLYSRRVKSWYDGLNELVAEGKNLESKLETETDPTEIAKLEVQIKTNKELQRGQIEIINNEGVTEREVNEAHSEGRDKFKDEAEIFDTLIKEDVLLLANPKVKLITSEQKNKFDENVGKYAPFRRAFTNENIGNTEDANMNMNPMKAGMGSLKRLSGSQKPTINPLLSAMANHAVFTKKAAEKRVYNMIYENLLKYPEILGKYYEQIPLTAIIGKHGVVGFKEISDPTVIIAKDKKGKSVGIKILDTYIAKVLHDNFAPNDFHIALKIFIESTRIFKAGTTGYFPPFLVANTTLDAVSRFVNTRTNLIPFVSEPIELTKAMALKNSAERGYMKEYLYLAGRLHTRMGWNQVAFKEGTLTGISTQRRWKILAAGMGRTTDFLGAPSNVSEIAPRLTEYIRARKQGKTQATSLELAGRVTAPFHHKGRMGGKFGQAWVKAVPYMNPALQVLDITGERLKTKEGAARFAIVSGALGAISGATLYTIFNRWDEEDKEKAINLLRGKSPKELAMYVYVPDPFEPGELIKIRVPQEHSFVSLGTNMYILEKYADARYTPKEIAQAVTATIPDQLQPWKGFMWAMSLTPQLPKTAIEIGTNTATFPEPKPIETAQDKNLVPEMRYSPYTTDFAKWLARTTIGKKLDLSPKMLDHFIKGNLGRASGYITGKPKMFNLGDIFRAKMYMNSTRQAREFWEKTEKYEQEIKYAKDRIKEKTGEARMTYDDVLSDYDKIEKPRLDKDEIKDRINYIKGAEAIFDKFSELKKLDPEIEEKGFEKLSNEIMQNLIDINKGKYAPKKKEESKLLKISDVQ